MLFCQEKFEGFWRNFDKYKTTFSLRKCGFFIFFFSISYFVWQHCTIVIKSYYNNYFITSASHHELWTNVFTIYDAPVYRIFRAKIPELMTGKGIFIWHRTWGYICHVSVISHGVFVINTSPEILDERAFYFLLFFTTHYYLCFLVYFAPTYIGWWFVWSSLCGESCYVVLVLLLTFLSAFLVCGYSVNCQCSSCIDLHEVRLEFHSVAV